LNKIDTILRNTEEIGDTSYQEPIFDYIFFTVFHYSE